MLPLLSVLGVVAVIASLLIPALSSWGPYFALCAGGAAHVAWLVRCEERLT
jgi:hypothetical protein